MNKQGYDDIEQVIERGDNALSPDAFEAAANETSAIVLDVRHQKDFSEGFIPRSIFIGIDGNFAPWVGALIQDVKQPILIVSEDGRLEETITRLSRVGFDNVIGYLKGGFEAWKNAGKDVDKIDHVTAFEMAQKKQEGEISVVDVRKPGEYEAEHLECAVTAPLDDLNDYLSVFSDDKTYFVHCLGGYRSVIAISILKSRGIHNVVDVLGGFKAIKETELPMTNYVCPTEAKK